MFKAKLIESENYYNYRSKQLMLTLIPAVLIGVLVNAYQAPNWLIIFMIGLYILILILMSKNQKRINAILGNILIEIDEQEIRIKSKKGKEQEIIKLEEVEKIILKKEYGIPQETIKELREELIGKTKQNFIIVHQKEQSRKLDFEVDSYFMIQQLNKLIEIWQKKGYNIERINHS